MRNRKRISFGLVVALTVSFTVCDADQMNSSRAYSSSAWSFLASFQMERPAQKAPCDLSFWRLTEDTSMSRGLLSSSRVVDDELGFRYALSAARPWAHFFACPINSFESPRAPPR